MNPTKENSLYLTIKQQYFDEIVAGTKYMNMKTHYLFRECERFMKIS